jgi:tetratricopeptide (TPR) repeat protein
MESLALDTPDFGTFGGPLPDLGDLEDLGAGAIDQLGNTPLGTAPPGAREPAADLPPPLLDDLLLDQPGDAPAPAARGPGTGQHGLDLFLGDLPSASSSPLAPLELSFNAPADPAPDPLASMMPTAENNGPPGAGDPLDIGAMFASLLPQDAAAKPAASAPVLSPFVTPPSTDAVMPEANDALPLVPPVTAEGDAAMPVAAGSGWSLRLAQAPGAPAAGSAGSVKSPAVAPAPVAPVPSRSPSLPAGMPRLEPPRKKGETLVAAVEQPRRSKVPLLAAGLGLVLAGGVGAFALSHLGGDSGPGTTLAAFAPELQRDVYPAYLKAADAVLPPGSEADRSTDKATVGRRAAAAELLLLASLGHGVDKSKLARATELLADVTAPEPPPPELARARAMLAVARARGSEAEGLLGEQASGPEGTFIKAMRRLRERRAADAVAGFRAYVSAVPDRILGHYLLGRALEETRNFTEADQVYARVLQKSPEHAGAQVGRARLAKSTPRERQTHATALIAKIAGKASPAEIGEAHTLLGEALLAQGQTGPALEALQKAVSSIPTDPTTQLALTEALLAEGRATEALTRLRSVEASVLVTAPGRLAMGAALISNGQIAEGTAQIESAAQEMPKAPRALTWLATAAEGRRPPDDALAMRTYREALAADPRFLPASLRLAALLQRRGKPAEAIALIKEAESAGAPTEALAVAWGQALIGAKDFAQAEAVLRKAVTASPQMVAARTALASALEAGGKPDDAEKELVRAVTDLPTGVGLRERLAEQYARHGKKEEALATLDAERAAGRTSLALQVQMGKLALDLGKLPRAAKELEEVIAQDPATPEALFTLARTRQAAGESSLALQEFKKALAFEASPELHLAYGKALAASGRDDEALGQLESAGDVAPARLERARIRLKRNEVAEALKEVEVATRLAPNDGRGFFLQGLCLDLMGRADEAASAWRKALGVTPNLAEAHYRLGRYEMDKGRQPTALTHFRAAAVEPLDKVAWEADLYFQLGFAEVAAGARNRAILALKRYLELSAPDAPARPEAESQLARLAHR